MYVCVCHAVTETDVRRAAAAGVQTLSQLTMATGAGAGCGSCLDFARATLEDARRMQQFPLAVMALAA
jgi:bacterioferritin-associated ferredoxin